MSLRHGIVVVAQGHDVRSTLGSWFDNAGYDVTVASTFSEAKSLLREHPDMVVSELKLGEFNGLHVAAHAKSLGIPAIVIGPRDIGLEHDAEQLDALYLSSVCQQDLLDVVEHELHAHRVDESVVESWRILPTRRAMMDFPLPGRSNLSN